MLDSRNGLNLNEVMHMFLTRATQNPQLKQASIWAVRFAFLGGMQGGLQYCWERINLTENSKSSFQKDDQAPVSVSKGPGFSKTAV
jgi:hypothetical protein